MFRVKALWSFVGEAEGDLSFEEGEVVTVTETPDSAHGWWLGHVEARGTEIGSFPANFVEQLPSPSTTPTSGAVPGSSSSTSTFPSSTASPSAAPGSTSTSTSTSSGSPAPRKPSATVVEVYDETEADRTALRRRARSRGRVVSFHSAERIKSIAVKSAERVLIKGRLRSHYRVVVNTTKRGESVVDRRFSQAKELNDQLCALFPSIKSLGIDLTSPELMTEKKTARVMELRRNRMEAYLKGVLNEPNVAMLLLTWLFPGSQIDVEEEEVDTCPSPATAAATIVAGPPVTTAPTAAAGLAPPPLRPKTTPTDFEPGHSTPFTLVSLDAFDELLESGLAVFSPEEDADLPSGPFPAMGQVVELAYVAMSWDGSASMATMYDASEPFDMRVGDFSADVPLGLHAIAVRAPIGSPFHAVLSSGLAYGDRGFPPHVPAFSQIIVQGCITAVSGTPVSEGEDTDVTAKVAAEVQSRFCGDTKYVIPASEGALEADDPLLAKLDDRFGASLSSVPRASVALQPGRKRVLIGEDGQPSPVASNGGGGGGDGDAGSGARVAGYQRKGSEPVDMALAEAMLRAALANDPATPKSAATAPIAAAPPPPSRPTPTTTTTKNNNHGRKFSSPAAFPSKPALASLSASGGATSSAPSSPGTPPPPPVPRRKRSAPINRLAGSSPLSGGDAPSPPSRPGRDGSGASSGSFPLTSMMTPITTASSAVASSGVGAVASPSAMGDGTPGDSVGGFVVVAYDELVDMKAKHVYRKGLDKTKLEEYLSAAEFKDKFGVSFEEFRAMPKWRQVSKRKDLRLY